MQSRFDVAIIGGGLNGLVTAGYLARKGRSVVVIEQAEHVGGTASTVEIGPGFRGPAALDSLELFHPSIIKDLRLGKHGLTMQRGGGLLLPREANSALYLDPEADLLEQIAEFSPDDAAPFAEFNRFLKRVGRALDPVLTQPLANLPPKGLGGLRDHLRLGWRLRRLGKHDMPEALRFLPMNVKDVLDERFKDESLKATLAGSALRGAWMAPRSAGSAFGLLHHNPHWAGGLISATAFAGGLPEALASAARAAGAKIRTGSAVTHITVDSGRATGVVLTDGTEIKAKIVVSAVDPRRTFLDLTGTEWLDPDFVEAVTQIRGRGSVSVIRLALDRLPQFTGAPQGDRPLSGRIQIGSTMDTLERAFDDAKYGRVPEEPFLTITIPSLADPSLAPEGKHVMIVWAQFTPPKLRDGDWSDQREALGDRVVDLLEHHAPGLSSSILYRQVETPADLEERFGLTHGCLDHVELSLDQLLYMRPVPGWYKHQTPIDGLYLCGPGTHPGGAGTGLSGKCAATQILEDSKSR